MHIVVADAGRVALKVLKKTLEDRGDRVDVFTDGLEALDFVRSTPSVDALIAGFELGSISGLELCWEVRTVSQERGPIYVIAMSSTSDERRLVEALDSGADDFISRPAKTQELYARLRSAERLAKLQNELILLATTDPLTGLLNRRAFFEQAKDIFKRATERKCTMTAVMLDIDHFKRVNDNFGHDVGDVALCEVAQIAQEIPETIVGRLGGEEFGIILEGIDEIQASVLANLLRLKLESTLIDAGKQKIKLTSSFGVAQFSGEDTIDALLKKADLALYHAKDTGRNKVSTFTRSYAEAV
ncbi:MAG: diguanylate cyclase [Cohaesibacteraceae bacterium]|nr:diguanylate cyclase [Cohaesibacteraceae bacterium]